LQNIEESVTELLSHNEKPTAIICAADVLALYAISIAVQMGLEIPGDISIIGSDNLPESQYYNPPLTTFETNIENISKNLVELLIDEIDNPTQPRKGIILKPELIVRKSCSPQK
jgi:LacI family purine nucleotide synthesis repressor